MNEQSPVQTQPVAREATDVNAESYVIEEIAVEELAIDGICGVY